jgi:hypothetical protein
MIQATLPRRAPQQLDLNQLAQQALQPWADAFDSWRTGMDNWNSGVANLVRSSKTRPDCGCPTCAPDPCSCRCCVTDADLVIEARVGERRIVPVIIENKWRRARDVEVELSSFTTVSDAVQVAAEIVGEATFTLAPCGHQEIVLVVNIGGQAVLTPAPSQPTNPTSPNNPNNQSRAAGKNAATTDGPVATPAPVGTRQLPDVDRCLVAYADLRIKGCDLRSVRVAVAILPRDCEAFTVDCGCSCCC